MATKKKEPRRPLRRRLGIAAIAFAALFAAWSLWQVATWPDVAALRDRNPKSTTFIERARQRLAADGNGRNVAWRWVGYDAISIHFKHAVVVSEDIGFFSHDGFATEELKIALRDAVKKRKLPRGASTITQQLAKNLWLSPSRNPLRKFKEAMLTRQLERDLGKRRILELYMNVVELGDGIYGVEAAARHYFGRSAKRLNRRQAVQLAASLPSPRRWHPGSDSKTYRRRVETTLQRMDQSDWLRRLL